MTRFSRLDSGPLIAFDLGGRPSQSEESIWVMRGSKLVRATTSDQGAEIAARRLARMNTALNVAARCVAELAEQAAELAEQTAELAAQLNAMTREFRRFTLARFLPCIVHVQDSDPVTLEIPGRPWPRRGTKLFRASGAWLMRGASRDG